MKQMIEVVAAVIFNPNGEVLCMQRGESRFAYTSFKYEFPGGKIEPNETPQEALRRELLEEIDLPVSVGPRLADVYHRYPDFDIHLQAFRCTALSPILNLKEHIAQRWLQPEALGTLDWAEADKAVITQLLSLQ